MKRNLAAKLFVILIGYFDQLKIPDPSLLDFYLWILLNNVYGFKPSVNIFLISNAIQLGELLRNILKKWWTF